LERIATAFVCRVPLKKKRLNTKQLAKKLAYLSLHLCAWWQRLSLALARQLLISTTTSVSEHGLCLKK